jgi:hypothetical protein
MKYLTIAVLIIGCGGLDCSRAKNEESTTPETSVGQRSDNTPPQVSSSVPGEKKNWKPSVTDHPRLWLRKADLPKLRSWATKKNPFYQNALLHVAVEAKKAMDDGIVARKDNGGEAWTHHVSENYAQLFAFMSLVENSAAKRKDYAQRARKLLMTVIDQAIKGPSRGDRFRVPRFATYDRSRWWAEAFPLTVDWIYDSLTAKDKAKIRKVFLRWTAENMHAHITDHNHPEPIGLVNDEKLLENRRIVRWSGNNYYANHMRSIGMMAMALDPADDPNNELRSRLSHATGAWLYVLDSLLKGDLRGGVGAEGLYYFPECVGPVVQFLLALHTAGEDNPKRWGPQSQLSHNDAYWNGMLASVLHSVTPASVRHSYMGQTYQLVGYGDSEKVWLLDHMDYLGPMALYDRYKGNTKRYNQIRWMQLNLMAGGAQKAVRRSARPSSFRNTILYYLLFPPDEGRPTDPRKDIPLEFYSPGIGQISSRTSWADSSSWFTYSLSWNNVDHQHADGNQFQLYRKGEWLTKEVSGYGTGGIGSSRYHNTMAIQNEPSKTTDGDDFRYQLWASGSQWLYCSEDPKITALSQKKSYLAVTGDATNLYNCAAEHSMGVVHASRSIVWNKPDQVFVFDRATTNKAANFKRFWLNTQKKGRVEGKRISATTPRGQKLVVDSLLPKQSKIDILKVKVEPAEDEVMAYQIRVQPKRGKAREEFLHVLQGVDRQASPAETGFLAMGKRSSHLGAFAGKTAVLFKRDLGRVVKSFSYAAPLTVKVHLISGLKPGAGYAISATKTASSWSISLKSGGKLKADKGGVLRWEPAHP